MAMTKTLHDVLLLVWYTEVNHQKGLVEERDDTAVKSVITPCSVFSQFYGAQKDGYAKSATRSKVDVIKNLCFSICLEPRQVNKISQMKMKTVTFPTEIPAQLRAIPNLSKNVISIIIR